MRFWLILREAWDKDRIGGAIPTNVMPFQGLLIDHENVIWRVEYVMLTADTDTELPEYLNVLVTQVYHLPGEL